MPIRIQLEIEDKETADLLLWLEGRDSRSIDAKLDLLQRAIHWLMLADPVQHPATEIFSKITAEIDGQLLTGSQFSGMCFQSTNELSRKALHRLRGGLK
jgi:hypothetical protein